MSRLSIGPNCGFTILYHGITWISKSQLADQASRRIYSKMGAFSQEVIGGKLLGEGNMVIGLKN